ncbi:unnamed protein product [Macrosiphum euphorbiae]|uniref:Mutator-like transposase domain-containing protein n=1 Tax=Macrosiphum euphorbiae TaxID=13131 RepID=A0AAV0Y326_9HEMI|nr:unnamed protein product [Macrosiphum euphorbiae]
MVFQNECRRGYTSVFTFKCKMCNFENTIFSERTVQSNSFGINRAIVNGSLVIGIGHTQLSELSAAIELPNISSTSYIKHLSMLGDDVKDSTLEEMIKAGNEEWQLAIDRNNLDTDCTPMCTVIADGQWSKRSYRTKYNAFSGAAAIIGYETKKKKNHQNITIF